MKKFFSLVLALVMVLSLTTVAWGADVTAGTYSEFKSAVEAGYNVKLTANINGDGIIIEQDITIDLGGFTYTIDGYTVGSTHTETAGLQIKETAGTVVIKNGSIIGSDSADKPGCRYGASCATSTHSGHHVDPKVDYGVKVVIQNYANLTLDNVTVKAGESTLYAMSVNSGDVTVKDTDIVTTNENTVAFDTCKYGSYDAPTVTVQGDSEITGEVVVDGGSLVVEDGTFNDAITVTDAGTAAAVTVEGGTFASALPTGVTMADGLGLSVNADGSISVIAGNKGTLYSADGKRTEQATGSDFVFVPAKALSKSVLTGNVAYYTSATAGSGNVWMVVGAADALNTDSILKIGGTEKYVRVVDAADVYYVATATEYTNIGEKCGQIVDDGFGTKYYTLKDNEGKAVDGYFTEGTTGNVLLGTAVVGMDVAYPTIVAHEWEEAAYDKDGYCNALKCKNCPATAKLYKPGTVPAGLKSEPSYYPVYELMVVNAPAASTTSNTVQSAETFDAGIAMYVGMSVMAAAGSAVVLKKKD